MNRIRFPLGASDCAGLWLLGLALILGCAQAEVGQVAGKVTLQGQPLTEGSVVFQDDTRNISVQANVRSDGTYAARTYDKAGLPPGTYRVAVKPGSFGTGDAPLVSGPPSPAPPPSSVIPVKYQDVATSGLTATVKPGANAPFDFDLVP